MFSQNIKNTSIEYVDPGWRISIHNREIINILFIILFRACDPDCFLSNYHKYCNNSNAQLIGV